MFPNMSPVLNSILVHVEKPRNQPYSCPTSLLKCMRVCTFAFFPSPQAVNILKGCMCKRKPRGILSLVNIYSLFERRLPTAHPVCPAQLQYRICIGLVETTCRIMELLTEKNANRSLNNYSRGRRVGCKLRKTFSIQLHSNQHPFKLGTSTSFR